MLQHASFFKPKRSNHLLKCINFQARRQALYAELVTFITTDYSAALYKMPAYTGKVNNIYF